MNGEMVGQMELLVSVHRHDVCSILRFKGAVYISMSTLLCGGVFLFITTKRNVIKVNVAVFENPGGRHNVKMTVLNKSYQR